MRFAWLVHGFGTRLADIPALFAQPGHPEANPFVDVCACRRPHRRARRGRCAAREHARARWWRSRPPTASRCCWWMNAAARWPRCMRDGAARSAQIVAAGGGSDARALRHASRPICTRPSGRASASAATRSGRRSRRSSESREERTSTWRRPTAGNLIACRRNAGADLRVEPVHHVPAGGVPFVPARQGSGRTVVFFCRHSADGPRRYSKR